MKPYCLLFLTPIACPAYSLHAKDFEFNISPRSTGLREGFSNPDTATPETYRDPYAPGISPSTWNAWTGTTQVFRMQIRNYSIDISTVHRFLNTDEELADLRFRQKHARPLFANYGPDDMTHEYGDPVPVSKVDQETSQTAEWFGTIPRPTRLELDFTSMDRVLIAQRIAYLESMQPTAAELESRQSLNPFHVVLFLATVILLWHLR